MLIKPDAFNGYTTTNLNGGKGIFGLNSVRQLIITNSAANTGADDRPIVIFYDGPERYTTDNTIRDSKPVIVNLRADFNGILYMPNSSVVFIPNGHKFNGFIVAKKYMRLKTADDFLAEGGYTYDESYNSFQKNETEKNTYQRKEHYLYNEDGSIKSHNTRDNGEPETINWLYTKISNPDNEIEMYVDDYGNVQFMDLTDPPKQYGTYDTFGRTDFTTHGYHISQTSANNLLLSGN